MTTAPRVCERSRRSWPAWPPRLRSLPARGRGAPRGNAPPASRPRSCERYRRGAWPPGPGTKRQGRQVLPCLLRDQALTKIKALVGTRHQRTSQLQRLGRQVRRTFRHYGSCTTNISLSTFAPTARP